MEKIAYIYVIINNINGKRYVGKTEKTVEERFKQHIKDSQRIKNQNRPLYRAFLKYGVNNFSYKTIEECSRSDASNREIYWIEKMGTYKNGYNATLGGDGSSWRDYKMIADKYQELQNGKKVASYFGCDKETVRLACQEYGVIMVPSGQYSKEHFGKSVDMIDFYSGHIIKHFSDMSDAGRYLIAEGIAKGKVKDASTAIGRAASGKRKTAYGFIWSFSE